jgi:hypothetical protein
MITISEAQLEELLANQNSITDRVVSYLLYFVVIPALIFIHLMILATNIQEVNFNFWPISEEKLPLS